MQLEIKLHRSSKHKHIVQLKRVFQDQQYIYMLMELCSNKSIFHLLTNRKHLTVEQTQYYMYQLIEALCYLHSKSIIHRDVKIGNLLLDENMHLKLADFGLATKLEFPGQKKHSICGTPNYIAPQIISYGLKLPKANSGHSFEVDVWSVGVIFYIMLIGFPPFETQHRQTTYKRIVNSDFMFPKKFENEQAKDLIQKILVVNPAERYTFEDILSHPFMNPIKGIPKSLPNHSLSSVPKFKEYQVQDSKQLLESAKSFTSIYSHTSSKFLKDQPKIEDPDQPLLSPTNHKDTQKTKLLTSVLSVSSLPKSLDKLKNLTKSMSNQALKVMSTSPQNGEKSPKYNMKTSDFHEKQFDENMNMVHITSLKKDTIWIYTLSNGYVGTYEPKNLSYKLLYNSTSRQYYEIRNDQKIMKISQKQSNLNQDILNRRKFIINALKNHVECPTYAENQTPIYLKNVYEVRSQSSMLFKLSNDEYQIYNYESHASLLIREFNLLFIENITKKDSKKQVQLKTNCINSKNKVMKSLYLMASKILAKIKSIKS